MTTTDSQSLLDLASEIDSIANLLHPDEFSVRLSRIAEKLRAFIKKMVEKEESRVEDVELANEAYDALQGRYDTQSLELNDIRNHLRGLDNTLCEHPPNVSTTWVINELRGILANDGVEQTICKACGRRPGAKNSSPTCTYCKEDEGEKHPLLPITYIKCVVCDGTNVKVERGLIVGTCPGCNGKGRVKASELGCVCKPGVPCDYHNDLE